MLALVDETNLEVMPLRNRRVLLFKFIDHEKLHFPRFNGHTERLGTI